MGLMGVWFVGVALRGLSLCVATTTSLPHGGMMPPPVSIIIPALNEAESIGHVVSEMPWNLISECIVVDNGSTDATASIAAQAGARVITSARGYGAACLAGSNAALPSSTILVYMDG